MTSGRMIELAVAVLALAAAVWLYRRKDGASADAQYGSQGAVLLLVAGAIMAIHALGALDYRPSQSELDAMQEQSG